MALGNPKDNSGDKSKDANLASDTDRANNKHNLTPSQINIKFYNACLFISDPFTQYIMSGFQQQIKAMLKDIYYSLKRQI